MGKKGNVEEGEISDSGSIEEISKEAFKINAVTSSKHVPRKRWTMRDVYNYPVCNGHSSSLYNLAWAQAVQKKSIHDILPKVSSHRNTVKSSEVKGICEKSSKDIKVLIDLSCDDMETNIPDELEEGEIDDYDCEPVDKSNGSLNNDLKVNCDQTDDSGSVPIVRIQEFQVSNDGLEGIERQVNSIREALEKLTVADADKSLVIMCSDIERILGGAKEVIIGMSVSMKDPLIQQIFSAIQMVNSVFCSMKQDNKEKNEDVLRKFFAWVVCQTSLFNPEQTKEIEVMMAAANMQTVSPSAEFSDRDKEHMEIDSTLSKVQSDSEPCEYLANNAPKSRLFFGPLLDLHKDHDLDSLPSPTRETTPCLPVQNTSAIEDILVKQDLDCERQDTLIRLYETDALKAVSTYQHKFGRNSFSSIIRLPSPTPSGEETHSKNNDTNDEVSSALNFDIMKVIATPTRSSTPLTISPSVQNKIKASAKSRDPRIQLASSSVSLPLVSDVGLSCSRKHKTDVESDGPAMKRQRDMLTKSGVSGCFEDTDTFGPQLKSKNQLNLGSGVKPFGIDCVHLPTILKDIAVNRTLLMSLFKLGEQNALTAESAVKSASHSPSTNSIIGVTALNASPLETNLLGNVEVPSQGALPSQLNDKGKTRMKPRDPRRILHNNMFQSNGGLISQQSKMNDAPSLNIERSNSNIKTQKQEDELSDTKSKSPQLFAGPDITRQLTNNLKNLANLLSVSMASTNSIIPTNNLPQTAKISSDIILEKSPSPNSYIHRNGTALLNPDGVGAQAQPQNNWEDVAHLFEGFDEKQKAAIQKERARRIEELNNMFAARKLSLVLDLDHTLLNSAKFGEIEQVHEEILRKKEEQDREKPHRHLFRFFHMGMWTKLRPGIWNFLEKASKLYELHLYTMGNKLYATEMAKVLDPTGILFAGRVVGRGDDGDICDGDERVPKSKDVEGVLGMESAIVIIDDSVRVWPRHRPNLIAVERYTYFPSSRRQFGLPGPSLLEIDHDERPEAGTLASSLGVIERLHESFFSSGPLHEVDVRDILGCEQRKILSGCRIVFSRVFPVGEANPHCHPLWQTAMQFGAVCINQIDDQVTHVVANSFGTDKVNWALSTGRFVVHPGWVEASALLYRRANEHEFSIRP